MENLKMNLKMNLTLQIKLEKDGDGYRATSRYNKISSYGYTKKDAIKNLEGKIKDTF